jgi:hypothetical protein
MVDFIASASGDLSSDMQFEEHLPARKKGAKIAFCSTVFFYRN